MLAVSYIFFSGNYFVQDIINISNNVINIYCVYKLDPIDFSRNNKFTIQNALFGAIKITKNANNMVFVLMKVRNLLTHEKKAILIILRRLET